MKTDKQKSLELILLALLVSAGTVFLMLQPAPRGIRTLPDWLPPDNPDLIQVIQADSAGRYSSYELEREGNTAWRIYPLDRPAEKAQLDSLLKEIARLQPVDLIAEEGSETRFGLNKKDRIELILQYDGKKVVFHLGDSTPSGHYYYVRKENDPATYTVRGTLPDRLKQSPSSYRDRQVLDFQADSLETLVFVKQNDLRSIKRDGREWKDSNGVIPDSRELNSFVKRAASLRCLGFRVSDSDKNEDISEEILKLTLRFSNQEEPIELTILQENRDSFLVRKADLPDPFLITRYDGEFLLKLSGL